MGCLHALCSILLFPSLVGSISCLHDRVIFCLEIHFLPFKKSLLCSFKAVWQDYSTKAEDEYVIQGNDVLIKCKIPSFVSDFVQIVGWIDNEENSIMPGLNHSNSILKRWGTEIFV